MATFEISASSRIRFVFPIEAADADEAFNKAKEWLEDNGSSGPCCDILSEDDFEVDDAVETEG